MWEKIKEYFRNKRAQHREKKARLAAVKPDLEKLDPPLTRKEYRLTGRGKYELDPETRKLTAFGLTTRLKHKLDTAMVVLCVLIVVTYIILIFF
ncbi:hypothetical protein WVIC16_80012 [Weissella viridescens]|uniref:Uncharacterized protein n=1 Tax=Weissella viridescens TaxID=1629 RepID=A0A0R2H004_WEIVI|nr:hypothetical protein [Weissella viridescens]KRN46040.1 hypothetical protein IV50_GL001013 [Weissella viridescens]MBX4172741.1 hypothetical protein [Weissella viridescens]MCB6840343.1 hypothetical protein [Weissella viridescens]MCB6847076.1 hypothetical protein [Weissella viridescens]QOD86506.1 hypothetical protein IE337_02605 [Weissella viridescens]